LGPDLLKPSNIVLLPSTDGDILRFVNLVPNQL
jgi:hypothetical protein